MFVLKIQIRKGYVVITAYVAPPVYRRRSADINSYLSLCGEDSFSETQEAIVRSRLVSLCVSILALLIQISREKWLIFVLCFTTQNNRDCVRCENRSSCEVTVNTTELGLLGRCPCCRLEVNYLCVEPLSMSIIHNRYILYIIFYHKILFILSSRNYYYYTTANNTCSEGHPSGTSRVWKPSEVQGK